MSEETKRKALKATEIFLEETLGEKVVTVDFAEALPEIGKRWGLGQYKDPANMQGGSMVLIANPEVTKIAHENPKLTFQERVQAIRETPWAKNWAKGVCNMVNPEAPEEEKEKCVMDMSEYLARRAASK